MIFSPAFTTFALFWIGGVIVFTIVMRLFVGIVEWFEKRSNYKIEKTLRSWEELE